MTALFHTAALSGKQLPLAFPIIQATWPDASLGGWLDFAEFFGGTKAASESGVIATFSRAADICGILAYRIDRDLRGGPILSVHLFTAMDVTNSLRPARALLDAADARARELGCNAVQIRLDHNQAKLVSRLRGLGLIHHAGLLWKETETVGARS